MRYIIEYTRTDKRANFGVRNDFMAVDTDSMVWLQKEEDEEEEEGVFKWAENKAKEEGGIVLGVYPASSNIYV